MLIAKKLVRLICLGVLLTGSIAEAEPVKPGFGADDIFALRLASDAQIDPDGARVAFVLSVNDAMSDRARGDIWLVDVKSGQQTRLTTDADAYQPRWSPDGRTLAYVAKSATAVVPQIFVRTIASGTIRQVSALDSAPQSLSWSPDGRRIAFSRMVEGPRRTLGIGAKKPEGARWADPIEVINRPRYRHDEAGYFGSKRRHIFVIDLNGQAAEQVTSGDYDDNGALAWSADGRSIFFSALRGVDAEHEAVDTNLYRVDLASKTVSQLTSRVGEDRQPALSPDGKTLAWLGYDDRHRVYENSELYMRPVVGDGAGHSLTAGLDRSIDQAQWAADGQHLFVGYTDRGTSMISRVGLDGSVRRMAAGVTGFMSDRPYGGGSFSVSRTGLVAYVGGVSAPQDVFVADGRTTRRLTHLNDAFLAGRSLGQVRRIHVTAPDGRKIDAWLMTPANYVAGRVPTILEVHGGPHASYGEGFSTDFQYFAGAGYAVLYANPRGSASYGADFANLINKNFPSDDYADLMATVDAGIASGIVDPKNLFVTGGSAGGQLTTWIVGKTHRFNAAAAQKPVVNNISANLLEDTAVFGPNYRFHGYPWENPMEYWRYSSLSLVGNVVTPTLVVVGTQDLRDPPSEAEQYYAALQLKRVPTELVLIPGANHMQISARPSQWAARVAALVAWFDRYRSPSIP